jgi:hypothetical protein
MSVEIKIQSEFIVTSVQKIWFDSLGSYATLFFNIRWSEVNKL